MALNIQTAGPDDLLKKIKDAIDKGKIETWSYDKDGDFTHTPPQWKNRAWLRPYVKANCLHMALLGPADTVMKTVVYAVYHGRFAEMLLSHFDTDFTEVAATALKSGSDNFKTSS